MGLVVPIEERFKFVMNNASSTPQLLLGCVLLVLVNTSDGFDRGSVAKQFVALTLSSSTGEGQALFDSGTGHNMNFGHLLLVNT